MRKPMATRPASPPPRKSDQYVKVWRVITSCTTGAHVDIAARVCVRFWKMYHDDALTYDLSRHLIETQKFILGR